jgi:hypothetical protein
MRLIGLAVILTFSLILAPFAVEAQQTEKVPRIGYLVVNLAVPPTSTRPSVKGCVTLVMARAATS